MTGVTGEGGESVSKIFSPARSAAAEDDLAVEYNRCIR